MTGSRNIVAFGKSDWIVSTTTSGFFRRKRNKATSKPSRSSKANGRSNVAIKNSIDLDHDARSIVGTRVLAAPRALVFSVWTDPRHLVQWWGPNGFRTTTHAFDFRPGGVWRFVMHGPDGRDYQNRITFDEIVAPERIVYRHDGAEDVEPVSFTQTVTIEDIGDGKTRLTWHGKSSSRRPRSARASFANTAPTRASRRRWRGSTTISQRSSRSARRCSAADIRRAIAMLRAGHLRSRAESIVRSPRGSGSTTETPSRAGCDPRR